MEMENDTLPVVPGHIFERIHAQCAEAVWTALRAVAPTDRHTATRDAARAYNDMVAESIAAHAGNA